MEERKEVEVSIVVSNLSKSRVKKIAKSKAGKKTSGNILEWKAKCRKISHKRFGIPGKTDANKQAFTQKYAEKLLGALDGADAVSASVMETTNGHLNVKRDTEGDVVNTEIKPDSIMKYTRYETVPHGGTSHISFETANAKS